MARRYDVPEFGEDEWHKHCGERTRLLIARWLPAPGPEWRMMLNAGPGVYDVEAAGYEQYLLDLFTLPLKGRPQAVCGRIEQMPFTDGAFDVVVCVGEVIAYCDPARAFTEFNRVLREGGLLIFDYPSSRSPRHWFTERFGRSADIFRDEYNETEEPIWIYSPAYIKTLLDRNSFKVGARAGTHLLSSAAKRAQMPFNALAKLERRFHLMGRAVALADVITVAARKVSPW